MAGGEVGARLWPHAMMGSMWLRYTAVVERDEDGHYVAFVPVLGPGVAAQGRTRRQALSRLRGVASSYVEALRLDGDVIPEEGAKVTLALLKVAV